MTPKQAYSHGSSRARDVLRLYHALLNQRDRKIRSDWKRKFCNLMHWPQQSVIQRIDSKDAIIILRHASATPATAFSSPGLDDVLRASVVLGISALDRYVHERIVKRIVTALRSRGLSRHQEEFMVPATLALELSADLLKAQKGGKLKRPANEVRKALQKTLHKQPFHSWREIEHAFALIGITDVAGQIQSAARLSSIKPMQRQLDHIVRRRNEIVHEGDLVRHERGGKVRCQSIDAGFVQHSLDFLDDLVLKLDDVA